MQAAAKTGTDNSVGSENYIKNNTIQPALDVKTGHKAAQSTRHVNNLNGVSIPPKTGLNNSKTAFLTSNNRPAIIPGNQGPVAQLVRASDS